MCLENCIALAISEFGGFGGISVSYGYADMYMGYGSSFSRESDGIVCITDGGGFCT